MNFIRNLPKFAIRDVITNSSRSFHQTKLLSLKIKQEWLDHNNKIYPPQMQNEPRRPAKENFKYSPDKLWYIAIFVRGMTVDEALRQLQFITKKGAPFIATAIQEARDLAIREHNVEFGTNLWVAESFVGKGKVITGVRRHAKCKMCRVKYKYAHYFVRLEEGIPPENYYAPVKSPQEKLDEWIEKMRKRRVVSSL